MKQIIFDTIKLLKKQPKRDRNSKHSDGWWYGDCLCLEGCLAKAQGIELTEPKSNEDENAQLQKLQQTPTYKFLCDFLPKVCPVHSKYRYNVYLYDWNDLPREELISLLQLAAEASNEA